MTLYTILRCTAMTLISWVAARQLTTAQVNLVVNLNPQLEGVYSGRLFVYTLRDTAQQFNDRNMAEQPAFYQTINNWTGKQPINFAAGATPSHQSIDSLPVGVYKLVAILDTNTRERAQSAPGNLYSRKEGLLTVTAPGQGVGSVTLNTVFKERPFNQTPYVKEINLRSERLSAFRKQLIYLRAALILPPSYYTDSTRHYPVVFIIPGWGGGGTHQQGAQARTQQLYGMGQGKDKIYVYLNPENQTPWGLHAFVDSRVNGPWGQALVNELLPHLRQHYRVTDQAGQTFLRGQSSGGYGAVWLALHYPDSFGACWVTSPDPLDFSSFTGVNLYKDANFYKDSTGAERGFYRERGVYRQTLRQARRGELFAGDGGQQQSFEAAFGKPDRTGRPGSLFDVASGSIDSRVVAQWQGYDLSLFVQQHGQQLKTAGLGPITIYVGSNDNFRLDESAAAFGRKASGAGLPIRVDVIPGADHFGVNTQERNRSIQVEMDACIR